MGRTVADRVVDIGVTLLCWLYFTLGFIVLFSPRYLAAALRSPRPEAAFQQLNRSFYRGFFGLLRLLAPRQRWRIDERIALLRSAVIVCNHRSYLDPLLLIALLGQAKTIVKAKFFGLPIFGRVLRGAGYLPSAATGRLAGLMLDQLAALPAYLAAGGTLFVFPEGTRSRDGRVGPLHQGALKIARQCRVPVHVLCLRNTDRLFPPGRFVFAARRPNVISVELAATIPADAASSPAELGSRVRAVLEGCPQSDPADSRPPYASEAEP